MRSDEVTKSRSDGGVEKRSLPILIAAACVNLAGCSSQQPSTRSTRPNELASAASKSPEPNTCDPAPYFITSFDSRQSPRCVSISPRYDTLFIRSMDRGYPVVRRKDTNEQLLWHAMQEDEDYASTYLLSPDADGRIHVPTIRSYEYKLDNPSGMEVLMTWMSVQKPPRQKRAHGVLGKASDSYPAPIAEALP